jgi:myo-inositol 2-dehydrogenase/D-chiro-inositol 1-dehydrogenase
VRIAVLGTGRMGAYRAEWFARRPEVERVLVGSKTAARARAFAARIGGEAGSYEEVLDRAPDAAVISTATPEHTALIHECAKRGLAMLCEKPVALTLEETEEALTAADEARVEIQLSFQRRFDPGWREARRLREAGLLGVLYTIRINSHDHEPSPAEYIPTSGGIFRDLHVHDFDIVRWFTGREVDTVYAVGAVRAWERFAEHDDVDTANVVLVLDDGLPVVVSGARHNPRGYDFRAEIFGSLDSVAVGLDERTPIRSVEPGSPVAAGHGPLGRRPYRGFLDRFASSFDAEMTAFLEFLTGRRSNPCPASESLRALRIALACDRSRTEGRPVSVNEVRERTAHGA